MQETSHQTAPEVSFVRIQLTDLDQYEKVHEIRGVFTREHGASREENAFNDQNCDIYLLYVGTEAAATARANYVTDKGVCISRIAVVPHLQGKGYGQTVVRKLINQYLPTIRPDEHIFLGTFVKQASFYEKLGFVPSGEVYLDENQLPLQPMVYKP